MEFRPPSYVDPVDDDKGSPSEDERIQEGDVIGEVKFVIIKETTDIYETQGRTIILIGHEIRKVRRTKKFDRNGTRIYETETALRGAVLPYAMKEASEAEPAPTTSAPSS